MGGGGTGGKTTTGGGGAGGAGGGEPTGCPDPLLSYDPNASYGNPIGPYTDEFGGFFAGRLPPFAVDTQCTHVVVGLASFSNPAVCKLPASVGMEAWSEAGVVDPDTGAILPVLVPGAVIVTPLAGLSAGMFNDSPETHVYKVPLTRTYKAGESVFVAAQLQPAMCVAGTFAPCDETASLRFRPEQPGQGWAPLSHAQDSAPQQVPDVAEQLLFGVDGCSPL